MDLDKFFSNILEAETQQDHEDYDPDESKPSRRFVGKVPLRVKKAFDDVSNAKNPNTTISKVQPGSKNKVAMGLSLLVQYMDNILEDPNLGPEEIKTNRRLVVDLLDSKKIKEQYRDPGNPKIRAGLAVAKEIEDEENEEKEKLKRAEKRRQDNEETKASQGGAPVRIPGAAVRAARQRNQKSEEAAAKQSSKKVSVDSDVSEDDIKRAKKYFDKPDNFIKAQEALEKLVAGSNISPKEQESLGHYYALSTAIGDEEAAELNKGLAQEQGGSHPENLDDTIKDYYTKVKQTGARERLDAKRDAIAKQSETPQPAGKPPETSNDDLVDGAPKLTKKQIDKAVKDAIDAGVAPDKAVAAGRKLQKQYGGEPVQIKADEEGKLKAYNPDGTEIDMRSPPQRSTTTTAATKAEDNADKKKKEAEKKEKEKEEADPDEDKPSQITAERRSASGKSRQQIHDMILDKTEETIKEFDNAVEKLKKRGKFGDAPAARRIENLRATYETRMRRMAKKAKTAAVFDPETAYTRALYYTDITRGKMGIKELGGGLVRAGRAVQRPAENLSRKVKGEIQRQQAKSKMRREERGLKWSGDTRTYGRKVFDKVKANYQDRQGVTGALRGAGEQIGALGKEYAKISGKELDRAARAARIKALRRAGAKERARRDSSRANISRGIEGERERRQNIAQRRQANLETEVRRERGRLGRLRSEERISQAQNKIKRIEQELKRMRQRKRKRTDYI